MKADSSEYQIENIDGKVLKDDEHEQVQNPDITDQLCAKCGQHFTSLIDLVHQNLSSVTDYGIIWNKIQSDKLNNI